MKVFIVIFTDGKIKDYINILDIKTPAEVCGLGESTENVGMEKSA
jgi:hypothetical protein